MEVNGKDDLKSPLLQHHNDVVVTISPPNQISNKKTRALVFKILGITCSSCVASIEATVGKLDGVLSIMVSVLQGQAVVKYLPEIITAKVHLDPNVTSVDCIIRAVEEDAGFGADLLSSGTDSSKVYLKLDGITSPHDLSTIQASLQSLDGVNHVQINVEDRQATISYEPNIIGPRSLLNCVREAGFESNLYVPPRGGDTERQNENLMYRNQFLWSCLFSFPIFVFAMVLPMLHGYGNWLNFKVINMLDIGVELPARGAIDEHEED